MLGNLHSAITWAIPKYDPFLHVRLYSLLQLVLIPNVTLECNNLLGNEEELTFLESIGSLMIQPSTSEVIALTN